MSSEYTAYSNNQAIYQTVSECTGESADIECIENQNTANRLKNRLDAYEMSVQKKMDAKRAFEREIVYIINLTLGVGLMSAYFYAIYNVSK